MPRETEKGDDRISRKSKSRVSRVERGRLFSLILLLVLGGLLLWSMGGYYRAAYPRKYNAYVEKYSREHQVEPSLVFAVMKNESSFNPKAVSSVKARGLMQITEETFEWAAFRRKEEREVSFDDLFDPELNIDYGTSILSLLLEEFDSTDTALCAYHAGWGNVKKWLTDPRYSSDGKTVEHIPFADTNSYVSQVLKTEQLYQRLYGLD